MISTWIALLLVIVNCADYDFQDAEENDGPKYVDPLTELGKMSKADLEEERKGSMDKQIVYVTFRRPYVKEKGILKLADELHHALVNKHNMVAHKWVQVGND